MPRPPKWNKPEELQDAIAAYFVECEEKEKMPTKAGLAISLNCHQDTLHEYLTNKEKDVGFSDAIKGAYNHIEEAWNQKLAGANATGPIFYLKAAFHYKDRVDHTTNDKEFPTPILSHVHSNESDEETPPTEETN